MKKSSILIVGVVAVFVGTGLYFMGSYNSLISTNEAVNTQWAKIETQYQRRVDLIPNLVNTVKGVMKQEQTVFTEIAEARTRYSGARTVDEKVRGANQLDGAIGRLLLIKESYPELKSSQNAQALIAELAGTENRISVERSRFNDVAQTYNLGVKRFPGSLMAALFGFKERPYFQSQTGAENAPQVNF